MTDKGQWISVRNIRHFLHMNTSGSREKTFWDLYIFPVKIWEAGKRAVRIIHPQKLISHLDIEHIGKVLDPCCGTGNFLLQLPESVDLADIYGTDTDAVSICIARLNMALKYPDADVEEICEHI